MKINKSKVRMGLSIASCIGVGVTACAGIYEGKKADQNQNVWENYKYTILSLAITEACMIGSHKIGSKQLAAMGGLLASSKALYDKTESKIREVVGNDKFEQIKKEVIKERASEKLQNTDALDIPGKGDELFYEPASDQYFYSTKEKVWKAYSKLQRKFIHDPEEVYDHQNNETALGVSLPTWTKMLGCPIDFPEYEEFGWYWGDGDGFWDYNWGFFGGPWIHMDMYKVTEGDDEYWMLDYGPVPPTWAMADKTFLEQYKQEIAEAKERWDD